jgi:hypothetical protein
VDTIGRVEAFIAENVLPRWVYLTCGHYTLPTYAVYSCFDLVFECR